MKRIIIVHQWAGSPESDWYPWLKKQLETNGYEVIVPAMPDSEHPKIEPWVETLRQTIGEPDDQTLLIGHSVGCQTIIRYLASLPGDKKFAGALLVTPWVTLLPAALPDEESTATGKLWLEAPLDWEAAKKHLPKVVAMFSNDDPYVPMVDAETFNDRLGAQITILENKGHLTAEEGWTEVPEVLEVITDWGRV